jgi:hypothetical protein
MQQTPANAEARAFAAEQAAAAPVTATKQPTPT